MSQQTKNEKFLIFRLCISSKIRKFLALRLESSIFRNIRSFIRLFVFLFLFLFVFFSFFKLGKDFQGFRFLKDNKVPEIQESSVSWNIRKVLFEKIEEIFSEWFFYFFELGLKNRLGSYFCKVLYMIDSLLNIHCVLNIPELWICF